MREAAEEHSRSLNGEITQACKSWLEAHRREERNRALMEGRKQETKQETKPEKVMVNIRSQRVDLPELPHPPEKNESLPISIPKKLK